MIYLLMQGSPCDDDNQCSSADACLYTEASNFTTKTCEPIFSRPVGSRCAGENYCQPGLGVCHTSSHLKSGDIVANPT